MTPVNESNNESAEGGTGVAAAPDADSVEVSENFSQESLRSDTSLNDIEGSEISDQNFSTLRVIPDTSSENSSVISQSETSEHQDVEAGISSPGENDHQVHDPRAQETVHKAALLAVPVLSSVRARERGITALNRPQVLQVESLTKIYGNLRAASDVTFKVHAGSFTGLVGPNGAGKTTVLSMLSALNRPTSGTVTVNGIDVWSDGTAAKRVIGALPDRLRLFDRLTGAQLLYYFGILHGLDTASVSERVRELSEAFGLQTALDRTVSDYSAGMQKKIGLACAIIHAPDLLVLDEPFETIDPVSAATVTDILEKFVSSGGSVVMSSHSLELIQRVCDHVVVINQGEIAAQGTVDEVRNGLSLEDRFLELTHAPDDRKGMGWLRASGSSD